MSRYEPLAQFLAAKKSNAWEASFDEIERRLGAPLPQSAYKYPAWWANQTGPGHSQTRGWRSVGWRTCDVDLGRQRVRFERERHFEPFENQASDGRTADELFDRARELTGITDRDALIREALLQLVARESGRRLARLGGTMPNLQAPPRRRFPQ